MSNKLLQLLAANRSNAIKNGIQTRIVQAEGSDEATLYLYDAIVGDKLTAEYWGGVCPQDLVPQITAIKAGTINLRINSPGGDVFAAQAIVTALKQHNARIVGHVDGMAASAATVIACACDEVVMAPGSMYMIHNAWTFAMGNRNDLQKTVDLLGKIDGQIAAQYVAQSGQSTEQVTAWMDAETWFTAEEALASGFATNLALDAKAQAQAATKWDLSAYANAPKAFCAPPAELKDTIPDTTHYAAVDHRARQQQRMALSARTRSL